MKNFKRRPHERTVSFLNLSRFLFPPSFCFLQDFAKHSAGQFIPLFFAPAIGERVATLPTVIRRAGQVFSFPGQILMREVIFLHEALLMGDTTLLIYFLQDIV